ncbi:energy transducer TonB [Sedimentitalea sp. JM2-8]|uniref:Energy transducer TonB n=1 Tax=Sedimentitalea xiamensis TaxID=3050037 RepID=A0ABT7FE44_9RHOB|nr:energy transducer TonB [Sedimentitalea xiamensis]MDK3073250.1 energy transducer TonB [Sedimentitalea xiamensis]
MDTGTKISAIAHAGLIGVAFLGGAFRSEPLPFEVREVSVISSEDFAALTAPREPETVRESPRPPIRPEPAAESVPAPEPEPVVQPPEPQPIPEIDEPEPVVVPEAAAPKPIERVAPEPVPTPPEDAKPDSQTRTEVTNDAGAETPQEQQEATAPEEATDRIVTEADAVEAKTFAPQLSPRPPSIRPERPTPAPTPTAQPIQETAPEPEPAPDTSDAVNAALAEALSAGSNAPEAPTGPPLSAGEKDALRVAVSECWNVGSLSSAALATTVVVGVSMAQDGKPISDSIRMLSSSGGDSGSARQAFEAARRAIIRCGSTGFDLPAEKYGQWRDIEMTFNPERMRIK